ncbi:hypothetical protein NQ315_015531 [Exocentrus adspersus]|uniref:Uncharacterized protein n=1 Tax=Exocentrus adspersus TaxID=1586481 RepID=A0AAV8VND6_9CUCU|nr:hypothetical protein NQ315_015531 [Exocentrus adspersus]
MRRVRRSINSRFHPKYLYVTPTIKQGQGSAFLRGCFSWDGVGPLRNGNTSMNRFVYSVAACILPAQTSHRSLLIVVHPINPTASRTVNENNTYPSSAVGYIVTGPQYH